MTIPSEDDTTGAERTLLPPVFMDPPDELDDTWTHGFLLVGHGTRKAHSDLELARVYRRAALQLIDRALDDDNLWASVYPAMFMCRHTLELYLKALIPDWKEAAKTLTAKSGNGHDIGVLAKVVQVQLAQRYRPEQIDALCGFIADFDQIDPKAMAFRFSDGAVKSYFPTEPNTQLEKDDWAMKASAEIWVDCRNLKTSIEAVFDALDRLCLEKAGDS